MARWLRDTEAVKPGTQMAPMVKAMKLSEEQNAPALVELGLGHGLVATVEDSGRVGGAGPHGGLE